MSDPVPTQPEQLLSHTAWLRRLARQLVRDADAAEDVVQDTLVAALEHGPREERDAGLRAWLATVARNFARRRQRNTAVRRYHEQSAAARVEQREAKGELERLRTQHALTNAVLALREPYRSAVVLRYQEGCSYRVLAKRFGVSQDAARKRVSRGVALLRTELDLDVDGIDGTHRSACIVALAAFAKRPNGFAVSAATLGGVTMGSKTLGVAAVAVVAIVAGLAATRQLQRPASPEQVAGAAKSMVDLELDMPAEQALPQPERMTQAVDIEPNAAPQPAPQLDLDELLRGRVIDPDGAPVAGASVEVFVDDLRGYTVLDLAHDHTGVVLESQRTDGSGEFAFDVPPGKLLDVRATKQELGSVTEPGAYAGEFVELQFQPAARFSGRVVRPDGSGVAGAHMEAQRAQVGGMSTEGTDILVVDGHTDDEGYFDFQGLQPGALWLNVRPERDARFFRSGIPLLAGETTELEIVVEPGVRMRGRVTDAITKAPIPNAEVGEGWTLGRSVRTDSNGEYVFEGFSAKNLMETVARAPGYGRTRMLIPEAVDGVIEADFELRPAVSATGRLLNDRGEPIEGAYVSGFAGASWHSIRSDEEGDFRLDNLNAGVPNTLFIVADGYGTSSFEFPRPILNEGTYEFGDIALHASALLRGQLIDSNGQPLADKGINLAIEYDDRYAFSGALDRPDGLNVDGQGDRITMVSHYTDAREGRTDTRGRFCFTDLAPGVYSVAAGPSGQGGAESEQIRVNAGDQISGIELVLDAGLIFEGIVVNESNEPIAGAAVLIYPEPPTKSRIAQVVTDTEGRFSVDGFAAGTYRIQSFATEFGGNEDAENLGEADLDGIDPASGELRIVLPPSSE